MHHWLHVSPGFITTSSSHSFTFSLKLLGEYTLNATIGIGLLLIELQYSPMKSMNESPTIYFAILNLSLCHIVKIPPEFPTAGILTQSILLSPHKL